MNSLIANYRLALIFILQLIAIQSAKSQTYVIDPALVGALTVTHLEQQEVLKDIHKEESNIRTFQLLVQDRMNKIRALQEKTYNYLSTVNAVVRNGKDIIYASTIVTDIRSYINKASALATKDAKLALIVAKTEYEFITRALDLILYINDVATKGGANNLLDNKQRIDLCIHVVNELREMRTLAYSIYRQMRYVQKDGVIKSIAPKEFRYAINTKQKADRILRDLKYISKRGRY